MPTENIDLPGLIEQFGSEDKCHEYLEELRWPDGVRCPRCDYAKVSRLKTRKKYECVSCEYQFSVRVGTILEDSKLPLWKWFLAVYMMCESRKGVSANQLKRMLGVSYKTAWYLCHRIRKAMADEDQEPLKGVLEADESFVGGYEKDSPGGKGKAVVLGVVARGGEVRLEVAKDRKAPAINDFVERHVSPEADMLFTDRLRAYKGAAKRVRVPHGRINHSRKEWVHGMIHTNTIEGVWSLFDRSVIGAYHKISKKHLQAYLHEAQWRYNNRENPYLFRDTVLELVGADRMEYAQLTGSTRTQALG